MARKTPLIEEILRHITNDVRLLKVVRGLLEHVQPSADVLDSPEIRTLLDLSGVIARRNGVYQIKSAAWEHLLRARLSAGYVGRLFARAGDWNRAIDYLGQAQSNQTEVDQDFRPELFAAIINAIHDSRDERQAFAVLDAGLRAAYPYPPRDLLLYALDPDERAFKLITAVAATPLPAAGEDAWARATARRFRPARILSTPYHSLMERQGCSTRCLPTDAGGDPLGLVSARRKAFDPAPLINSGRRERCCSASSATFHGR
ncbi:MAG: hypothetical protein IPH95_12975 [Candidatus Promineofilum sp.]|nr:hypothetical protein [Promineifilum sp.]